LIASTWRTGSSPALSDSQAVRGQVHRPITTAAVTGIASTIVALNVYLLYHPVLGETVRKNRGQCARRRGFRFAALDQGG
jgi:hypothetical protein